MKHYQVKLARPLNTAVTILALAPLLLVMCGTAIAETPKPEVVAALAPAAPPALEQARALTKLGELKADGDFPAPDFAAAADYFRQAANLGDKRAQLRLGEFMVQGRGVQQDVGGGIALIRGLADSGDANALFLLGEFYAKGAAGVNQGTTAVSYYERAAAAGRSLAYVRLGQIYLEGKLVPADQHKSATSFLDAAAIGRDAALVPLGKALADGRLASYGSPADGINLLRQADKKGVLEAAAALADCYLNGKGVPKSVAKALALLQSSLDAGNAQAGRRLTAIYRDGRKTLVRRNLATAQAYFARIKDQLDPRTRRIDTFLLDAAPVATRSGYLRIEDRLLAIHPQDRPSALRKLHSVNPNAYVFAVQRHFRSMGLYNGQATGQLSTATLRAIYKFCSQRESRETCSAGPMTPRVAELIAATF